MRRIDQTLCEIKLDGSATDVFTSEQDLADQKNLLLRKLQHAEQQLDSLRSQIDPEYNREPEKLPH
eukprot:8701186-Prorocentrum_lima.AAC.1